MNRFFTKKYSSSTVLVLLAVAVYLGLTLLTINKFSTWHDESYSATLIEDSYSGVITRTSYDVHPPFYYLALKTWSVVAGDSVVGLRLFSTVCMLGAILVAWRFFRSVYGERAGLNALFGMVFGSFLIRYGQEMRMYALGALLASISTFLLWKLIHQNTSRMKRKMMLIAYAAVVTAAVYTHYFLFFLLVAHGIYVLWNASGDAKFNLLKLVSYIIKIPRGVLTAMVLPVILFLPWLPSVLSQFREVQGAFWISPLKVETLTSTVINFFSFMQQWELVHWTALYGLVVVLTCLLLLSRWFHNLKDDQQRRGTRLIGCLFFVPLILLILISLPPMQPAYQDRYLAFYAPFIYGAFGMAIAHAWHASKTRLHTLGGILAVIILAVGVISVSNAGNSQGWRPFPHFTMQQLSEDMMARAPEAQVVSTSLWTFLDAHIVFKNTEAQLLAPEELGKYGNYSAIYGRDELVLNSLNNLNVNGSVWIINETGKDDVNVPRNWLKIDRLQRGYAEATLYIVL